MALTSEEIQVGKTYHNGKEGAFHSERKVIKEGDMAVYPLQQDRDCVTYEVVSGRNKGRVNTMTRERFRQWAKGVVVNG